MTLDDILQSVGSVEEAKELIRACLECQNKAAENEAAKTERRLSALRAENEERARQASDFWRTRELEAKIELVKHEILLTNVRGRIRQKDLQRELDEHKAAASRIAHEQLIAELEHDEAERRLRNTVARLERRLVKRKRNDESENDDD